jgi:hypothetical protein
MLGFNLLEALGVDFWVMSSRFLLEEVRRIDYGCWVVQNVDEEDKFGWFCCPNMQCFIFMD